MMIMTGLSSLFFFLELFLGLNFVPTLPTTIPYASRKISFQPQELGDNQKVDALSSLGALVKITSLGRPNDINQSQEDLDAGRTQIHDGWILYNH
jgi:hypothetical protein